MPTIFIALQCFKCSTMQVKQEKKSSNKWTCVVCNEKQSVCRVFAQGFMAKHLRQFVQSFNMSRQFTQHQPPPTQLQQFVEDGEEEEEIPDVENKKIKRTDWTKYIDPENESDFTKIGQDEQEDQTDKKPSKSQLTMAEGNPEWSYTTAEEHKNLRKRQPTTSKVSSKQKAYITKDDDDNLTDKAPWKCQPTTAKRASKWKDYITENDDVLQLESGINSADKMSEWNHDAFETVFNHQKVEEDIHPDFL